MAVKSHVHKYVRAVGRLTPSNKDSGLVTYYKCADPDCSHYQKDFLVLGKHSICNKCGQEFTLPNAIRLLTNRPHCKTCTRGKPLHSSIPTARVASAVQVMDWDIEDE